MTGGASRNVAGFHWQGFAIVLKVRMKIAFTKGSGKYDLMEILMPGQPPERVNCPKQEIIPHDMVHYAIEHTLKARGFLGRVKNGEASSLQMTQESESDSVERLVEVFQPMSGRVEIVQPERLSKSTG